MSRIAHTYQYMMRIAHTYQSNQWPVENFWNQVARDAEREVALGADQVSVCALIVNEIVAHAIPAGNA